MKTINEAEANYASDYKIQSELIPSYHLTGKEFEIFLHNIDDPTTEIYRYVYLSDTSDIISYLATALNILKEGKHLSIMLNEDFINAIEDALISQWDYCTTYFNYNGDATFVTEKKIKQIGEIKCVWISKKYPSNYPVGIEVVEELSQLMDQTNATKGILITTGKLTKEATEIFDKNCYRVSYITNDTFEKEFFQIHPNE